MERFSLLINPALRQNTEVCVISYNTRGFGIEKQEYCKYLLSNQFVGNKTPILCIQEHFIMRSNSYKIIRALEGFHLLIKPAVKQTQDKGRAKNGMFIAVPENIKNEIADISPAHWRIQAALFTCKYSKLLIINSYFPVDTRTMNPLDIPEPLETLEAVKHVIENNEFDELLFLGDINADFLRHSAHCNQ